MKASEELAKISLEILDYANVDPLANQVVTRANADPEFMHFIGLTCRAVMLIEKWRKRGKAND